MQVGTATVAAGDLERAGDAAPASMALLRPVMGTYEDALTRPVLLQTSVITSTSVNTGGGYVVRILPFNVFAQNRAVARKLANSRFLAGEFNVLVSVSATPQHRGGLAGHMIRSLGIRAAGG